MRTQNQQILESLQRGTRLSPLDALREFGCFRLSARVYDLRNKGYTIKRDMQDGYAIYYIPQPRGQTTLWETE